MKTLKNHKKQIITAIVILLLIIIVFLLTRPKKEEEKNIGFGDELREKSSAPIEPDEFDLSTNIYTSPSGSNEFKVKFRNKSSQNELTITETDYKVSGVVNGKWSQNEEFVMFSKAEAEGEESHTEDSGNIWTVSEAGENEKLVLDLEEKVNVDYVSNGSKIAYVTNSKIGTVNVDGSGQNYLYEFTSTTESADVEAFSQIEYLSETQFKVTTPEGTTLTFDF